MTQVEEPHPSLSTPQLTTYTYNALGKLTQSNQSNQTRTWAFDALGRLSSQTLPESGTTSYSYNSEGLIATRTDARNITTTITYHSTHVHQIGSRTYSDTTPPVSFDYNSRGLRSSMYDGLGWVTYAYDANTDRLTQESRTLSGVNGTFSTSYAYNVRGDVTSMTYPTGRVVNFNYATGISCCDSRLTSIVDQSTSTTIADGMTFNAAGRLLTRTLNPGTTGLAENFTYNNRMELTQITGAIGSAAVVNLNYNYGGSTTNTVRLLSRTDAIQPEHSITYNYDSFYRLNQAMAKDATWDISWAFDTWGNRTSQVSRGLAISKVGTQTSGYSNNRNTANTYDAAGNQTNDGIHSYGFNAENQITQMDGAAAEYAYDGDGRRMKKKVGTETTYYFYGVPGLLCEFTTTNTGTTQAASTDRAAYRTSDRLGSAVLVLNGSGIVLENNRTFPYGEPWLAQLSGIEQRFTSYQRDTESGLDYAMARLYGSNAGRFNSPDSKSLY